MASMMNHTKRSNNPRRQNGNRPHEKRQIYSPDRVPAGNKPRGPGGDRDRGVPADGVYRNQRFTHLFISLVGSVVQIQIKNGNLYEGILKTTSPKMDLVLELAHIVEDCSQNSLSGTPSRDRLIDKLIIKQSDIVSLTAPDTDLEYAVKDSFTDTAISKYNGEMKEKDMKELQPWDADGAMEVSGLEGDKSNGWDPNEMFRTNKVQFNVQSSYDDSLSQYTTKLVKRDTDEYKKREESALKMAAEIEGSEQYKKHTALENGDENEEDKFSAVVREGNNPGGQPSNRYVPPNKRSVGGGPKGMRGGYNQGHMNRGSPPQHHNYQQAQGTSLQSQPPPSQQMSGPVPNTSATDITKLNGEGSSSQGQAASMKPSQEPALGASADKLESSASQNPSSPNSNKSTDKRKGPQKERDAKLQELKEFSSNFRLDTESDKEKASEGSSKDKTEDMSISSDHVENSNSSSKIDKSGGNVERQTESKGDDKESAPLTVFKSTLNPNASVFQPKQSQQQQQQQIATPPRQHTPHTSPLVHQQPLNLMTAQPVYPGNTPYIMQAPPMVLQNPQNQSRGAKRVTVSVRPDFTAAAAQAATGQPLLAQSSGSHPGGHSYYYNMPMLQGQPSNYQMAAAGQISIPVQTNQSGQRYMNPPSGMGQSTMPGQVDQPNPGHSGQFGGRKVHNQQQTGPMPAHMTVPAQGGLGHPNMSHHQMPNPQNTQMNGPPQSGGQHAPAPSPVHNTGPNPQQHQQHQAHPPTSGTPQPGQVYSQVGMHGQQPPLQPSPHNPTSPQSIQPMPYQYSSSHGAFQMQMQGGPQFSLSQQSSVPTSVTYSLPAHGHHSPHMTTPTFVMMPNAPLQQHPHIHNPQYQGHPMAGPGGQVHNQHQILQQGGVPAMPTANHNQSGHHQQAMQPLFQQVHNQGGPPVPNYPQQQ